MNAIRTLTKKMLEIFFPERVAEIRRRNRSKRTAMQAMLDADLRLRERGCTAGAINDRLSDALHAYRFHRYGEVSLCIPRVR